MKIKKRNFLKTIIALSIAGLSKNTFPNGNPYRDRFQSYRQTFRIQPNKEETERIIKNIIGKQV